MASTVNVPMFGPVSKGKVVGITIGGTVVAAFLIYKKEQTAKKQKAAAAAAQAQAANAYGYGPGFAYGYGQGGYYSMSPYGYGASGGFNASGYYGYGLTAPPGGTAAPVANTTNAQWAQAAINQLSQDGYDRGALASALGAYDVGAAVTGDQQGMIQAAIGVEGYPPVPGKNGFPPSINVQGTPGGGSGGGQSQPSPQPLPASPSAQQVEVPTVTGIPLAAAVGYLEDRGLKPSSGLTQWATGGAKYVTSQSPLGGTMVPAGSTVSLST